jgi:hypothetical protein
VGDDDGGDVELTSIRLRFFLAISGVLLLLIVKSVFPLVVLVFSKID